MTNVRRIQIFAWGLGAATLIAAVAVWSQVRLRGVPLTAYDIFPLLGLSAFGLMWTHYVTGPVAKWAKAPSEALKLYFRMTSWLVLVLILLHPGIFLTKLWLDGLGLPPFSYLQVYTTLASRIALLLGTLSFLAFLSFELHRKFKQRSWWKYIEYTNIAAMFAIFYHGFTLGGELNIVWFRGVWAFYFVSFISALVYNQLQKKRRNI